MSTFRKHIEQAVESAGSQKKLAIAVGCSQQQISYLLHEATRVSAEMAMRIEAATGGTIKRNDLRPDIFEAHP